MSLSRPALLLAAISRANAPLLSAALATVICAGLYAGHRGGAFKLPWVDKAEGDTLDARFKMRGTRAPVGDDIVIVGLDDDTRARAPQVFQKRAGWAQLITALGKYEPLAIGIDGFFSSPEITLAAPILEQVRAALAATPTGATTDAARAALEAVIEETRGDEKLAAAIAGAKVVHLGMLFFLDEEPAPAGAAEPAGLRGARYGEAVAAPAPASRRPASAAVRTVAPLPAIGKAARGAGFVNVIHERDGAVRRTYAVIERGGRYYMPLGLALARVKLGEDADLSYVVGDEVVRMGDRELAIDRRGRAQLDFLGPAQTFPHYSAADVIDGTVPREALAGKLVFVGYTDAARDKVITPFDPLFPGVELHATLAYDALHGQLLRRAGPWSTVFAIIALGGVLTLLQLRRIRARRAWLVIVLGAVALAGYLILVQWLFVDRRLVVDVAAPLLSFLIVGIASLSAALIVEGREKARIKNAFSQYLDDKAVQQILADPSRLRLGGERRELTVLFSDIRGFSLFSEKLDPQQLSSFLNEYLTPMTELVLDSGGLLDKYIGDAVMAVYGAPLEQTDHAVRACRTALAMQQRLDGLNTDWKSRDLPQIAVGIGVNSGPMSVGNMGSQRRFDYTVVGDAVNLGSRLEALTKEYGAHIIVGERTRELCAGAFRFRELDLVRVKGKDRPARVYELIAERDGRPAVDLAGFEAALACYRRRDWDAAETAFQDLIAVTPDDGPSRAFLERVRRLRGGAALPADWDGVYEQIGK